MFVKLFTFAFLIGYCASSTLNASARKLEPLKPSEEYTHHLEAIEDDPKQYVVYWKYDENEIQFEVHCRSYGWVGLGLSPNGGMKGADVALGWVDSNGKGHLKDCHALDRERPISDKHQDLVLIDASQINDYTILKYKRKLATCDTDDREIKLGTYYLIFAWNNADPLTGNDDWMYHYQNRTTRTTILLNFKEQSIEQQETLPADTWTYDIRMPNVTIAAKGTYYFCEIFELPKFAHDVHLIQYEMIFGPQGKKFVHHVIGFECAEDFVPSEPLRRECGAARIPDEFNMNCMTRMSFGWGVGGNKIYSFPPQAGYRFVPSDKPRYMLLEMHYDNPQQLKDVVDNTGVRLYFTPTLRKYDLGIVNLGTSQLQIPPNSPTTKFTSICYPECTKRFIPDDGIYFVTGLLHTHLAGKAIKTSVVRDGKEIANVFDNPTYDFEYQNGMDIEPFKVLKNDAFITECVYDTSKRPEFTSFGFGTHDEMCINFVYYYPRIPEFQLCQSSMPRQVLMSFYRSLIKDGLVPGLVISDDDNTFWQEYENILNYFKKDAKFTPTLIKKFVDLFGSKVQNRTIYCGNPAYEDIFIENTVDLIPTEHYVEPDVCKTVPSQAPTTSRVQVTSDSKAITSSLALMFPLIQYVIFKYF